MLIEILSNHNIRHPSIAIFSVMTIRLKFDSFPKLTWTSNAKRLLSFFALNFLFMFVEFWVGIATNSLGLLSDAFHMLCDNASLFYSAVTALVSHQPPTPQFPYGFARLELVTSFTNGVLLLYISFNLLAEAVSRLIDPPEIGQDHLLLVSVLGLLVNTLGLCFTNDTTGDNMFLRSIFLHILVDTLGSVAVILSSICVVKFGIFVCDSICSALIAVSIFGTAIPLIRDVVQTLMLRAPEGLNRVDVAAFGRVDKFNGWEVRDKITVMTVKIGHTTVMEDHQTLMEIITRYVREKGVQNTTIETAP
jgi:zinc transporter 5/7